MIHFDNSDMGETPDHGLSRRSFVSSGLWFASAVSLGCLRAARGEERGRGTGARVMGGAAHLRPLFARFPRLAQSLPWIDLGGLPTPVSEAPRLGARLGVGALQIKGDDQAGAGYGGSKARKLELFIADAIGANSARVLTLGGAGSNHALATAVHARRHGLGCSLFLLPERQSPQVREHLLAERHLGCEQHAASVSDWEAVGGGNSRDDGRSYVIPVGGTSPLGNVGYVNAGLELAEQCASGDAFVPDVIYIAAGTTGTAAGLYVGLRAAGLPTRLVAVRASSRGTANRRRLVEQIGRTARFLRQLESSFPAVEVTSELLRVDHGFAGGGYAIPSEAGRRAASLAHELEGLVLDQTYTAKTLAALFHDAPELSGSRVLFWNTYDPRRVAAGAVTPRDLPRPFRGYFR